MINNKNGTVTCVFGGGLGNQLFRYAATRAVALRTGRHWIGDISGFRDDLVYRRRWLLGNFRGPNEAELIDATARVSRAFRRARSWAAARGYVPGTRVISEGKPSRYSDCLLRGNARHLVISGNWQSERYFSDVRDAILSELVVRTSIPDRVTPLISQIERCANAVAVHVRTYSDVSVADRGQLPHAYYTRAVASIRERHHNTHLFVFTDSDALPAQLAAELGGSATVIPGQSVGGDEHGFASFMAMMRCKHFVIANSSFSWWAAWLSQHHWPKQGQVESNQRRIIAPTRGLFNADFVPEWWTALDADG